MKNIYFIAAMNTLETVEKLVPGTKVYLPLFVNVIFEVDSICYDIPSTPVILTFPNGELFKPTLTQLKGISIQ